MNRFATNALAAVAALFIFAASFTAVVTVPVEPAFATAPVLA